MDHYLQKPRAICIYYFAWAASAFMITFYHYMYWNSLFVIRYSLLENCYYSFGKCDIVPVSCFAAKAKTEYFIYW